MSTTHNNSANYIFYVATQKKVTKSKGKSVRRTSSKGQSTLKKTNKTRNANRTSRKTSRRQPTTAKNLQASYETPPIRDSGAVRKARASVEDIVEDAQKIVEETTEPTS